MRDAIEVEKRLGDAGYSGTRVDALNGRIFATLSSAEQEAFWHVVTQGRKVGVAVLVEGERILLKNQHVEEILRGTNAPILVDWASWD